MTNTRPISSDLDQNFTLVRALRSLRAGDVEVVTGVVNAFGGRWSVQTGDDYDGYLFMMIEPSAELAGPPPSYMVSGKTGQTELATVRGDDYQALGQFGDIYGLATKLASCLLDGSRLSLPSSTTTAASKSGLTATSPLGASYTEPLNL